MDQTPSLAQQYYKVAEAWQKALEQNHWKLAIWSVAYEDVEMVSSFFELERTAIGQTDEIYFKFNSVFDGDNERYEQSLWNELISWFAETPEERYDMHAALIKDGYLKEAFVPNSNFPKTLPYLLQELERFRDTLHTKQCPKFIIEFGLGRHHKDFRMWFWYLLGQELPEDFRFLAIDIQEKRLIKNFSGKWRRQIMELSIPLGMSQTIKQAMKQGAKESNSNATSSAYEQLVLELMEALPQKNKIKPLIRKLLEQAKLLQTPSVLTSTYLIIAHVYNTMRTPKKGLEYIDKALESTEAVRTGDRPEEWYPLWRSCLLFKAAFYMGLKERDKAFEAYETVAKEAGKQKDHFYIMEAYRLCATLKMKRKRYIEAFEYACLALYAGSFLDINMRRSSTYVYAANVACNTVYYTESSKDKLIVLHEHLTQWIGSDWETVINSRDNLHADFAPLPELPKENIPAHQPVIV